MRITLSQVLPGVANALNLNQGSQIVLDYINRAQEELLNKARWVGTKIHYSICTSCEFITWPRQMATIEALAVCGRPLQLHNEWYKFIEFGAWTERNYPTLGNGGTWSRHARGIALDRTDAISFTDINPTGYPKKLKIYSIASETVGARILLQFYDINGNWIRSNDPKEGWVDGEFVALSPGGVSTFNTVGSWEGVQKPITNGTVRITELDTVTGLERNLALYDPDETNPTYRRTSIPALNCGLSGFGCARGNGSSSRVVTIQAIGKQRFIPALNPRDYLMLQSVSAIIAQSIAVFHRDNNSIQDSVLYEQKATSIMDEELSSWIGYGSLQVPQMNISSGAGSGQQNFI